MQLDLLEIHSSIDGVPLGLRGDREDMAYTELIDEIADEFHIEELVLWDNDLYCIAVLKKMYFPHILLE
jgi:hypothetical protein